MWGYKLRLLPWRFIALTLFLVVCILSVWLTGYSSGLDRARADGQAALSKLQAEFDGYRTAQAKREVEALRAWSQRYQAQVAAGHQAESNHLAQIAQLERTNRQLQRQVNDVTQRWMDEKGKTHPIECVFTRGFVQQYNAALGYDDTASATAAGTGAASGDAEAADTRLRNSGVTQQDILANLIDNALQCRAWRSQVNGLLDEREGLQQ
ncbi:TPA: hypothetical protein PBQ16_002577 [Escherichia coli]|nr:hypothetical protein [Escherichia coli]HDD9345705.1 hypothetical protein [Escherichia coli]